MVKYREIGAKICLNCKARLYTRYFPACEIKYGGIVNGISWNPESSGERWFSTDFPFLNPPLSQRCEVSRQGLVYIRFRHPNKRLKTKIIR